MPREKSCGAVVFRRGSKRVEYLLLHYEGGHWDFVKGNVEANESEEETVMRELKEETSIREAQFVGGFKEGIDYSYWRKGGKIFKEVVFFLVQAQDGDVELSFEHVGYEWLGYEKALERLTFMNARKVLKSAHGLLETLGIEAKVS